MPDACALRSSVLDRVRMIRLEYKNQWTEYAYGARGALVHEAVETEVSGGVFVD